MTKILVIKNPICMTKVKLSFESFIFNAGDKFIIHRETDKDYFMYVGNQEYSVLKCQENNHYTIEEENLFKIVNRLYFNLAASEYTYTDAELAGTFKLPKEYENKHKHITFRKEVIPV